MEVPPLPTNGPIDQDLECVQCGYNLRGLERTGRCPECGTKISLSARGNLLKFANPDWLRKIKLGADLMYYGIGVGIVVGVGAGIIGVVGPSIGPLLMSAMGILTGLLYFAALYLMTTQELRVSLSEGELTWRRILRAAAVFNFAASAINQPVWPDAFHIITLMAQIGQALALVVMTYGYFAYAETFAIRIPHPKLAKSTRIVKWALTIYHTLVTLGIMFPLAVGLVGGKSPLGMPVPGSLPTATMPATTTSAPGPATPAVGGPGAAPPLMGAPAAPPGAAGALIGVFACFLLIPYLFFSLWALRLLIKYRQALKVAVRQAREMDDAPGLSAT